MYHQLRKPKYHRYSDGACLIVVNSKQAREMFAGGRVFDSRALAPCLLLDVDHFKAFNDTYGHLAGDQCLKELANTIQAEAVRPHDVAARIGGEEFAILLPDTPKGRVLFM